MTNREGQTPLHASVCLGWLEAARFLIERGAITDAADSSGSTPPDIALELLSGTDDGDEHIFRATELAELLRANQ